MKKLIILISILLLYSCKTGIITEQEKKGDTTFEKFDFEKLENEYKNLRDVEHPNFYNLKDGSSIYPSYPDWYILPAKPAFYTINKVYYKSNDFIKEKGKHFGDYSLGTTNIKIGIWTYFDEQGKLINEVDEDKKFSAFDYNELLKALDREKAINLRTGKNRENLHVFFDDKTLKNRKIWTARVYSWKKKKGVKYYFDFNTGKLLMKFNMIGLNDEDGLNIRIIKIIDNTVIYKTENGIDYSETEWKEHLKTK